MNQNRELATPARMTAIAAARLPRLFLLTIGMVYILSGLFYRDPWKTDDVSALASMFTALAGTPSGWLLPQVGNLAYAQGGPLEMWAGALAIKLFAPLLQAFTTPLDAAIIASRLPNILWFGILAVSVWYGTYLLGRRPEAQPLALPFGGEPAPQDYGRMLADAALLLTVATVGIIWRMHETSAVPAQLACQALVFYAVARMLDHPLSGAVTLGLATAACFLARGWLGVLPPMAALALVFLPPSPLARLRPWLLASLALALVLALLWWLPAAAASVYWKNSWLIWSANSFSWPSARAWLSILRDLPWFLWPTWPLALLALWRWRNWLGTAHIRIPAGFAAGAMLVLLASADPFEPEYSTLAVPAAVLAALALPTMRRGAMNTLDWFSMMCFSLTAAAVWLGWVALQTGWPAQIAANIARQTRGFESQPHWLAISLAVGGSLAWFGLVFWRLRSQPAGLWRGTALSAGGLISTWLLLATLWMPALDYARSYREVAAQLAQAIKTHQRAGECVRAQNLGSGQRASFLVFEGLDFGFEGGCKLVLQQLSNKERQEATSLRGAEVLWTGRRTPDRHESFRLLRQH